MRDQVGPEKAAPGEKRQKVSGTVRKWGSEDGLVFKNQFCVKRGCRVAERCRLNLVRFILFVLICSGRVSRGH